MENDGEKDKKEEDVIELQNVTVESDGAGVGGEEEHVPEKEVEEEEEEEEDEEEEEVEESEVGMLFEEEEETGKLEMPKNLSEEDRDQIAAASGTEFKFEQVSEEQEHAEREIEEVEEDTDIAEIPEPEHGIWPVGFNVEQYNAKRKNIPFKEFVPSSFKRTAGPMRLPQEIPQDEQLLNIRWLDKAPVDKIHLIAISSPGLNQRQRKMLGGGISKFVKTEILILRSCGLRRVDLFKLPNLRSCDLSGNEVSEANSLVAMFSSSPECEVIDLTGNPVSVKPHCRHKLIAVCPFLRIYNKTPVGIAERVFAVQKYGSKEAKRQIDMLQWDLLFRSLDAVLEMTKWQPERIKIVSFPEMGLEWFHVGSFPMLETIDLNRNKIKSIEGTGMEQCEHLEFVDLRYNLISKKKQLNVFASIPSLLELSLEGNKLSDYRSYVIFLTRDLKGTNRHFGLSEIDAVKVGSDERMESLRTFGKVSATDMSLKRWETAQVTYYGHNRLNDIKDFKGRVRRANFSKFKLDHVDLSKYASLQWLDLSHNQLKAVQGLENLKKLRVVDLSKNKGLDIKKITDVLKNIETIESIRLYSGNSQKKEDLQKFRIRVISQLVWANKGLRSVEGSPITMEERIEAFKQLNKPALESDQYRTDLALTIACTPPQGRQYHYKEVGLGKQYDPTTIVEIPHLNDKGLTSPTLDFMAFLNLERLNLTGNELVDIIGLGLQSLKKLRVFDVSRNKIKTELPKIAQLIDNIPSLEIIALRGNPIMAKSRDRQNLIGMITSMREITCNLTYIDEKIKISDRVDAWRKAGGSEEECELLRYRATLYLKAPKDTPPSEVKALNLNDSELNFVDLSDFINLETLLLRKNKFPSLDSIVGISNMKNLKVLDIRDNLLNSLSEVVRLVNALPKLTSVGFLGNKLAKDSRYRQKLMSQVPRMREVDCVLTSLDEVQISVTELVEAWKHGGGAKNDVESFRWRAILHRKVPPGSEAAALTQLKLKDYQISVIDLQSFPNLVKLSLANNKIQNNHLLKSNVLKCSQLEALDLTDNYIKDLNLVAKMVDGLPKLSMFWIIGNPCFPRLSGKETIKENKAFRIKFLSKIKRNTKLDPFLTHINGHPIKVSERVEAAAVSVSYKESEVLRLGLQIQGQNLAVDVEEIDLTRNSLAFATGIGKIFKNLKKLVLAHNKISDLSQQGLGEITHLEYLDISFNEIDSLSNCMDGLSQCAKLKHVVMKRATKGPDTTKITTYFDQVGSAMIGLETIEGKENPHRITEDQRKAIEKLDRYVPGAVNPNNVVKVNLNNRNLPENHFMSLMKALSLFPIDHLNMNQNPLGNHPNYRFLLIYSIPTMQMLDDIEISMDERANANRTARKIAATKDLLKAKVRDTKFGSSGGEAKAGQGGSSAAEAAAGAKAAMDSLATAAAARTAVMLQAGSLLTKAEIFVSYVQLFMLLIDLIPHPEIVFPNIFINIVIPWSWIFSLDIDFAFLKIFKLSLPVEWQIIKFFIFMCIPLLLGLFYKLRLNKDKWVDRYVEKWGKTRLKWVGAQFLILIVGFAIGYFADWANVVKNRGFPTSTTLGIVVVIMAISLGWNLIVLLVVWRFRKKHEDPTFWFNFLKTKKRLALFFITILYMPIIRVILLNYKCDDAGLVHVMSNMGVRCPTHIAEWHWLWWVSLVCGLLYGVGIPLFFTRLIRRGIAEIDRTYGIGYEMDQIEKLRAEAKEKNDDALKKLVKEKEKEFTQHYASAARSYESAAAYLYNAYERRFRFYKIAQMIEKLLLLVLVLFLASYPHIETILGNVVIGLFALLAAITRPFSDGFEDTMDLVARVVNTLNITVGTLLSANLGVFFNKANTLWEYLLIIANVFSLAVSGLVVFIQPIRGYLSQLSINRQLKKVANEMVNKPEGLRAQASLSKMPSLKSVKSKLSLGRSDGASVPKPEIDSVEKPEGVSVPTSVPEADTLGTGSVLDTRHVSIAFAEPPKAVMDAMQKAKDMAGDVAEGASAAAQQTGDVASRIADAAREAIPDDVIESGKNIGRTVTEAGGQAAGAAKEAMKGVDLSGAAAAATSAGKQVAEGARDVAEAAGDMGKEAMEATPGALEKAGAAAKQVGSAAVEVGKDVAEATPGALEKAGAAAKQVGSAAVEVGKDVAEATPGALEKAGAAAKQVGSAAVEVGKDVAEGAKDLATAAAESDTGQRILSSDVVQKGAAGAGKAADAIQNMTGDQQLMAAKVGVHAAAGKIAESKAPDSDTDSSDVSDSELERYMPSSRVPDLPD